MGIFTLASISFICGIDIILLGKVFYENLENCVVNFAVIGTDFQ
jgi:hypothetical protein